MSTAVDNSSPTGLLSNCVCTKTFSKVWWVARLLYNFACACEIRLFTTTCSNFSASQTQAHDFIVPCSLPLTRQSLVWSQCRRRDDRCPASTWPATRHVDATRSTKATRCSNLTMISADFMASLASEVSWSFPSVFLVSTATSDAPGRKTRIFLGGERKASRTRPRLTSVRSRCTHHFNVTRAHIFPCALLRWATALLLHSKTVWSVSIPSLEPLLAASHPC